VRLHPLVLAAALLSLPLGARAQVLVQGTDHVLIGRVHARAGGQVIPLARFGALLSSKGGSASVQMASAETGALSLVVSGDAKKNSVARVHWQLLAGSGARVPSAEGDVTVKEGGVAHVTLSSGEGVEVFASFETGRAASFHPQRIVDVFGYPSGAAAPAPVGFPSGAMLTQEWRASNPGSTTPATTATPTTPPPQIAAMPAGASGQPQPKQAKKTFQVSCAGGSEWLLSTGTAEGRCAVEVDGTDHVTGGTCDDDAGNAARCSCTVNGGAGSCVSTRGAGSCEQVARARP
jgi:hypothetical protein